jgi:site-specific DNA recombinase
MLSLIQEDRKKLKKRAAEMVNMRVGGEWSKETFIEHFRPIEERIKQIDEQLPEQEAEIDFLKMQYYSGDTVLANAQDLYSRLDSMDFENKRTIVESITKVNRVGKDEVEIDLSYEPTRSPKAANPTPNTDFQKNTVNWQRIH